jgi:cysteine desulfurase
LGVAALILKRGVDITPVLHGGGQERDIRSGTLNAPSIVSFGVAARLAIMERERNYSRISHLREKLAEILGSAIPDVIINGGASGSSPNEHLPGVLSVTFPGTEGD